MSMGLVVLIIWLLNITEHHCVNTPNSNSLFTHCLRRRTFLINFLIFKTHRLLNGAIICKNTNHMLNAFIFCLRIVYASLFSYMDEYHQFKSYTRNIESKSFYFNNLYLNRLVLTGH